MMPEVPLFPPKNLWDVMQSKIDPCNKLEVIVATTSQVLTSFALSELPRYALQTPATVNCNV